MKSLILEHNQDVLMLFLMNVHPERNYVGHNFITKPLKAAEMPTINKR